MAVSNKAILNKMMQELHQAQSEVENEEKVRQHMERIQLLCELVLDEKAAPPIDRKRITAEEMKAMMGNKGSVHQATETTSRSPLHHDDANGKSIFDF